MELKEELQKKIDLKTKPVGSLGKLEDVALRIGLMQKTLSPELKNPVHIVFAGDHGLADEGVSLYPKEVTAQMVLNFLNGGAAVNVFCRQHNIKLMVVDAGVDYDFPDDDRLVNAKVAKGTKNILIEPAMTLEQCENAMNNGAELVDKEFASGSNIISFGEMGIGNTSSAALLLNKYTGLPIEECTGRGTGHDDEGVRRKTEILKKAAEKYDVSDAREILATFGGFEIAMMTGAMLQAKKNGMVILVDGFITTSALLAAYKMDETILNNCIFTHKSNEKAHSFMLEYLKGEALIDLNMRLGEGTGAVVAYPLVQSAVLFLNEMASFETAGVSDKE
ncbi:MAG: nicotinate-nucleotide--dimethylbenzimidazole phosphoribosyltransferase [Chlorobi bacterium]|nr:nicotinate-nucleotide--dimethylbenzimidazole phosphoribosyltransferase [Chlorobiota bacterium]